MSLRKKQAAFIEEYLRSWNATEAALRAGYSERSARSIGAENLTKPDILAEIQTRLAEKALTADEALVRLAAIARGDLGEFTNIRTFSDLAGHPHSHLVKKIKTTAKKLLDGSVTVRTEIELHDSLRALELLGKHYQLFNDAPTISIFNHTAAWQSIAEELGQADELEAGPEVNGHYGQNGRVR